MSSPAPPSAVPAAPARVGGLSRRRAGSLALAVALVAAGALVAAFRYLGGHGHWPPEPMVDLEVYKQAGRDLLHGRTLYQPPGRRLVFTYPPFASFLGVLVAPFGRLDGNIVWTVVIAVSMTAVVRLAFAPALGRLEPDTRLVALGAITGVSLVTHPLLENVFFGQINTLLVLAVLADWLVPRSKLPRGVLTGVATAIKLTPALFVVFAWWSGRRRMAVTAALTAAACTGIAGLVAPHDTWQYFRHDMTDTSRIGDLRYTSNQSLRGLVARNVLPSIAGPVWVVALAAVVLFALSRAARLDRSGRTLAAVAVVGALVTLVSPISWIHHHLWGIVVVGALVDDGRDRRRVAAAAVLFGVYLLRLPWWGFSLLDEGPLLHPLGTVLHEAYVLLALAGIVLLVRAERRDHLVARGVDTATRTP